MSTQPKTGKGKKAAPRKKNRARTGRVTLDHGPIIVFLLVICGCVTLFLGSCLAWFIALDVPAIRSMDDYHPLVATTLLDRHGRPIDTIAREYRIVIAYDQMAPLLPAAFVAAEDSRFWEHGGLDLWSMVRALINNLRSGRRSQGGSTITQQVTRSLMLNRKKSYSRKITEAVLAYRLDHLLSKQDILTIYLNEIYLGEGAYGVEAAARTYFGKHASRLTLAEAALLAGLPQAPSRYSPRRHPEAARARQRYVLNRMAEDGIISPQEARDAFQADLTFRRQEQPKKINGYFSDYVRSRLEAYYGREALFRQGFTVTTTLDSRLQRQAFQALTDGLQTIQQRQHSRNPPQGSLVALDSANGRILAMIGGRNYLDSPFNRAVTARRQPGSVFKPLVYAAAFEQGMSAETKFQDAPIRIRNRNGSVWEPGNYSSRYRGPLSLRDALVCSSNMVTIRLLQKIGLRPVLDLARRAGIRSHLRPELPLALGASPVTLLEMTAAYTIFANQGMFHAPTAIIRVRDRFGRVHPWPRPSGKQVITPATARLMTSILQEVLTRGTGRRASGIRGAAGKTGTSDRNMDSWFIGYTDEVTAGIWLGHDRDRSLGTGESGGRAAAPIWKTFMQATR